MAAIKKVKKAQKGIKATADSSIHYDKMASDAYESAARNMRSPKYRDQAFERAEQAGKDSDRQKRKGKPGYDANGFPIKKNKTGGVAKAKTGAKVKDKKWIQKAVNPAHKGFCTPMTKATCTPKRKALAKTFKKMAKARKK